MGVYGKRLFGKVDTIPGIGHVATRCFHINFMPVIPIEGWLVLSKSGRSWRGCKIPISFKSYVVAWGRYVAIVSIGLGAIFSYVYTQGKVHHDTQSLATAIGLILGGATLLIYLRMAHSINYANYARACELAKLAGWNENGMLALAKQYGRPPMTYGFAPINAPLKDGKIAAAPKSSAA